MNLVRHSLRLLAFGGALLASAHAQLVHLAFTEGLNNGMIFRANSATIPWNHTGGYISRFDVWYDVSNPTDPTRNLWRASVYAYGLGNFEIVRPHEGLSFFDGNLALQYWTTSGAFESLEFDAQITGDHTTDGDLPAPPFTIASYSLYLDGGASYFPVPDFGEGYGYGAFEHVTARIVSSVMLNPVPEPSAYALGGVALLGLAVAVSKRRRAAA